MKTLYRKFKRWATWATVEEACELRPLSRWRMSARSILPLLLLTTAAHAQSADAIFAFTEAEQGHVIVTPVAMRPPCGSDQAGWSVEPGKGVASKIVAQNPWPASSHPSPPADTPPTTGPAASKPILPLVKADDAESQPTPMEAIGVALRAVNPHGKPFVDIGCGLDCRAGIVAARDFGATSVIAIEIDPETADSARRYVEQAGLSKVIEVITADAANVEFPNGAVGFVYLFEDELKRLTPKLKQLDCFASYAHAVPDLVMEKIGGDRIPALDFGSTCVYLWKRPQPMKLVYNQPMWNGRPDRARNGCNCSMCQSLRRQQANAYRYVPADSEPATQAAGHWVDEPIMQKKCFGTYCKMVQVGTKRVWVGE